MEGPQAPLANVIMLGVRDVAAERDFYRGLGWPQLDSDMFIVFELRGAVLALFPVERLAAESHVPPEYGQGGIRSRTAIIAERPEEVDDLADRVRAAGGTVTKEPAERGILRRTFDVLLRPRGSLLGGRLDTSTQPHRCRRTSRGRTGVSTLVGRGQAGLGRLCAWHR